MQHAHLLTSATVQVRWRMNFWLTMIPAETRRNLFSGWASFSFGLTPFHYFVWNSLALYLILSLFLSSSLILSLSITYTYCTPCSTLMKKTTSALSAWRSLTLPIGILGLAHAVTRYIKLTSMGETEASTHQHRVTLNDFDRSVAFVGTIFEKTWMDDVLHGK